MLGFRQRSLHSAGRRLRNFSLGLVSNRPPRTQRVYCVTINGQRYKRLVLPGADEAARLAANLQEFGSTGVYPSLILQRERELWVEFIEGERLTTADDETVGRLARLFAVLHGRNPVLVPTERTRFAHEIATDLDFLHQVGVLAREPHRRLRDTGERLAPKEVWVGYDCTDAILKNFVRCPDGRIRGIDVESLGANQLIGSGFAKAAVRWLGPQRERFLSALHAESVPDFRPYVAFVELSFTAFWLKSSFLERKKRFVDPTLLERFIDHA